MKLLGGPVPNADGGPCPSHSLVPIPAVPLTASRLKWGLVPIDIMMTSALILAILHDYTSTNLPETNDHSAFCQTRSRRVHSRHRPNYRITYQRLGTMALV